MTYVENRYNPVRRKTLEVKVGNQLVGGNSPILIQSMTNTNTRDIAATVKQSLELAEAGCELIRITAPTVKDAECLQEIVKQVRKSGCQVPFSADIHFQPKAAFESLKWVDKVRINPGNFVDSKSAQVKEYDDKAFERGVQRVYDSFAPLVREAKERGVALRIGTNHGSLSDRIMYRYGDTVEGLVESALEYVRVCEAESFDQVIFSMKASNPRIVVQAYRLLANRLKADHKDYPFHVGVTEAGDGEDGRLKSAVGMGALLLDGLGDTIRVSLTENPSLEIPVAQELLSICHLSPLAVPTQKKESIDFYNFKRREVTEFLLGDLKVGGREPIAVGCISSKDLGLANLKRKAEWMDGERPLVNAKDFTQINLMDHKNIEIQVEDVNDLEALSFNRNDFDSVFWSVIPSSHTVLKYRYLTAWLDEQGFKDPLVLRTKTDGTVGGNMHSAATLGSLLCDGLGDLIHVVNDSGVLESVDLGYDILQAAGSRKSKTDYISCPSCGRTLFDLEETTQEIRQLTSHLGSVSIAIMGCIVNGPGEMADADFGYVGGAPNKVNLYVGRDCIKYNISEKEAPAALVELIKEHGKWIEPALV